MTMPTEQDFIYWAGVFDYAGCLAIKNAGGHAYPHISLRRNNPKNLQDLKGLMGGTIRIFHRRNGVVYHWELHGKAVIRFLKKLLPYTRVKKAEMDSIIELSKRIYMTKKQKELAFLTIKVVPKGRFIRGRAMSNIINEKDNEQELAA